MSFVLGMLGLPRRAHDASATARLTGAATDSARHEADRQRLGASQYRARDADLRAILEREVRQALREDPEAHLHLAAGEVRPETEVEPVTEAQELALLAPGVESIG